MHDSLVDIMREWKRLLVSSGDTGLYVCLVERDTGSLSTSWGAAALCLGPTRWKDTPLGVFWLFKRGKGLALLFQGGRSWKFWRWVIRRFGLFGKGRG